MLSRAADSLYWMSRYFERADHCARVVDANYSLMLNPSKPSTDRRWQFITGSLGLTDLSRDPQTDINNLVSKPDGGYSIMACIASARDNASAIREQISSEMWECLNQLYHEVTRTSLDDGSESDALPLLNTVREGAFKFGGVTDSTMSHDEGWHFVQFGKYMERACAISKLVAACFAASDAADDLDWVALLSSCLSFEAYCKVYTADLSPDRVAEFLLLNPDFPYTVRHAVEGMMCALKAIAAASPARKTSRVDRLMGQLRASLAYMQIDELLEGDLAIFLKGVNDQCAQLHRAVYDVYIDYPIMLALEA